MANIKDCPGFETFGADVKEARKVKQLSRKTLAEQVNIDWRYLANIENDGTIPSLPVIIQLKVSFPCFLCFAFCKPDKSRLFLPLLRNMRA